PVMSSESPERQHKLGCNSWGFCLGKADRAALASLQTVSWLAYSSPLPSNHNQLLSLFLMCCCIAVSIGGFFYCWMFSSLQYSFQFSATTASAIGFLALLTLFLVHPVRCMFTIIVPTLGTKQGRRLLLSACFMIVTANIIPNIMSNIRSILQVIKCICKDSSESLLTSTVLLDDASWDFARTLKTVFDNIFLLSQKMTSASQGIKEDFLEAEMLVQKAILWANRITAGFVLFYLVFESSWYLKSYLTDLQFDNIYITKKLEDLARQKNATHLLVCSPKKLIKSAGLRLSREEFTGCLMRIFLVSLVFILTLVIITADYISFYLAQATVTEVSKLPVVPINFWIKYNVSTESNHGSVPKVSERPVSPSLHEDAILNTPPTKHTHGDTQQASKPNKQKTPS
uniref:Osteoclast stimulatory transmembrane protein n=1 Tax=Varanus komodoensis TaxID=61221 RepID=A0A8D2J5T2_VARKO